MANTDQTWRICPIAEFFEVSMSGDIRSIKTNRILKPSNNGAGYLYVSKVFGKKKKHYYVHRLVAAAFLENPQNLPEVNHINGNKADNAVSNLEWCTRKENLEHAIRIGLKLPSEVQRKKASITAQKSLPSMRSGWKRWLASEPGKKKAAENAKKNGLIGSAKTSKKVKRLSDGKIYPSISEASRDTGHSHKLIRNHCNMAVIKPLFSYT
ncbi:MAG: hypothetical protein E7590_00020 [Ruminococcaceae bacterium]|nr:hypothetical protein [Oscillospiraceae bacterium]